MKIKPSEVIEKKGKNKRKIFVFDPPNILRRKVGRGGLEAGRLERAEALIDDNQIDFKPLARKILDKLRRAFDAVKQKHPTDGVAVEMIVGPVMEMKASSGMFGYMLASEMSGLILDFLESISAFNEDAFEILEVYEKAQEAIIKYSLKGDGGKEGRALAQELHEACSRYAKKYKEKQ